MEKTVFLAECGGYQKYEVRPAVLQVLNFFLLERPKLVAEGKKVLLKPNLVMSSGPETAATTHPQVVARCS